MQYIYTHQRGKSSYFFYDIMMNKDYEKKNSICKNTINIGFVSLFMQLGSTLIYSTGTALIANRLFGDRFTFLLIRNIGESGASFYKLLSGFLSDIIDNRKLFLYLGYGLIIFFKIMFWFATFDFLPIAYLKILFIVAHLGDRLMNSIRDAPRDALLFGANNKAATFGLRKLIGSIGSILGGLVCIVALRYAYVNAQVLYGLAIVPIVIANLILYYTVHDIETTTIAHNANNITYQIPWSGIGITLLGAGIYVPIIASMSVILQIIFSVIIFSCATLDLPWSKKYIFSYLMSFLILQIIMWSSVSSPYIVIAIFPVCFYILYMFLHSQQYARLSDYSLKRYYVFLLVSSLLSLAKMNDSMFFTVGNKFNLYGAASEVVMFTLNYISQLVCSFLFSQYANQLNNKKLLLTGALAMLIVNVWLFGVSCWVGASLLAIFLGMANATDLNTSTVLSSCVPTPELKGTLFGIFYCLMGLMSIFCTLITNKLQVLYGLHYTALLCAVPALIAILISYAYPE